jgi:opacity protein-like surface antigen
MKKILLTCAALASLAAAMPAAAQPFGGYGQGGELYRQAQHAERQIEWCQRSGGLSWREARTLRYQLQVIEQEIANARYGGVDRREYWRLERQLQRIEAQIRYECHDGDRDGGRGDYGNRGDYGRDDGDYGRGGRGGGRGPVILEP